MAAAAPPVIFSAARRRASAARMERRQVRPDAARWLRADLAEDMTERLAFLRHQPQRALLFGAAHTSLPAGLSMIDCHVTMGGDFDAEQPYPVSGFDFIASLCSLDTLNDLPGALIHARKALAPGGLMLAGFLGAGSLPALRAAMLEADGDRPAPRLHPQIDVRAGAQLLQRAGFADPVADTRTLEVRFASLSRLVSDLRDQALGNVLARHGPALGRAAFDRASAVFGNRTVENFEIITVSGWNC